MSLSVGAPKEITQNKEFNKEEFLGLARLIMLAVATAYAQEARFYSKKTLKVVEVLPADPLDGTKGAWERFEYSYLDGNEKGWDAVWLLHQVLWTDYLSSKGLTGHNPALLGLWAEFRQNIFPELRCILDCGININSADTWKPVAQWRQGHVQNAREDPSENRMPDK